MADQLLLNANGYAVRWSQMTAIGQKGPLNSLKYFYKFNLISINFKYLSHDEQNFHTTY